MLAYNEARRFFLPQADIGNFNPSTTAGFEGKDCARLVNPKVRRPSFTLLSQLLAPDHQQQRLKLTFSTHPPPSTTLDSKMRQSTDFPDWLRKQETKEQLQGE